MVYFSQVSYDLPRAWITPTEREIVCKDCPMASTFFRAMIVIIIIIIVVIFLSIIIFIIVIVMITVMDIFIIIIITNINNLLLFLKGWFYWARKFTETQGKWHQEEAVYAYCGNNWCGPWRKWIYLVWRKGNYRWQFSSFWSWNTEDTLLQELSSPVVPAIWLGNPPPSLPPSVVDDLVDAPPQINAFCPINAPPSRRPLQLLQNARN